MTRLVLGLSLAIMLIPPGASKAVGGDEEAAAVSGPIQKHVGEAAAPVAYWLESSLKRVYPASKPGTASHRLAIPRNGKASFQVCVRNESSAYIGFDCSVIGGDDLAPQVRLVGLVPLPHFTPATDPAELEGVEHGPGLVPDPLLPETAVTLGPFETRSFWVSLKAPADASPGRRTLTARIVPWGGKDSDVAAMAVDLDVSELVVAPRRDFPVIHWWRGEATWDYYKTGRFDERWWELTRDQLRNMFDHGSDVVSVPLLVARREPFERPCQLLEVDEPEPGKYRFDWERTRRFVAMCREIGFKKFEWSHLWIYWGAENPVRVYTRKDDRFVMLWPPEISGYSDVFLNFLDQFLPEFHAFLTAENLLDDSYFHLSDEPGEGQHIANYKRARQILREKAPWMKVMDALSNIEYGKQGLTDIPIPLVSAAQAYIDAGIPHWVYYCCAPTGPWLNRFLDTPLSKIRMSGPLFYRLGAKGFLHWGFNYWHLMEREAIGDPFHDASNGAWPNIPYGDPFMIYPGKDGPLDSIRWEVFAESLQDYAILQTAGVHPDDPRLADLKSYADFSKDGSWIHRTIDALLQAEDAGGRTRAPSEAKPGP